MSTISITVKEDSGIHLSALKVGDLFMYLGNLYVVTNKGDDGLWVLDVKYKRNLEFEGIEVVEHVNVDITVLPL